MNFKVVRLIIIGIFSLFLFKGCDDPLDVTPRDSISPEDMGEDDIDELLNGTYVAYQNAGGHIDVVLFDQMGGNLEPPEGSGAASRYDIKRGDIRPDDGLLSTIWSGYYEALYRANTLIEVLENQEESDFIDETMGVAHFLRAYGYYNLVTRFGGVPILEENTREQVPRDSEEDVWDFIIEELEKAIDLAPPYHVVGDYYYASAEAAKALLARTALTVGDMELAEEMAEEVIATGDFELDQDYDGIFHDDSNSETIFAFRNTQEEGVPPGGLFTPTDFETGGSYFWVPTEEAMDMFSDDDRRSGAAYTFFGNQQMVNKYRGGLEGGDPIQVTRLAEMYLISAEAQGPSGIDRLNELRQVRGLDPLNITDEQEYMDAILQERNKELIWENFRFYDLVRTGRALEELEHFDEEYLLRLPIPVSEIDQNPELDQNPGY